MLFKEVNMQLLHLGTVKSKNILMAVSLVLFFGLSVIAGFSSSVFAAPPPGNVAKPQEYLIGPEDVLDISVWKNQELSRTVTVRPDGKISLPLIGDVQAGGVSPSQLRNAIVAKLKEYQENAVVSVIVQTVNSYRIFIVGEVRSPGTYLLKSKTTVLQAISMAGGFSQFASKNKIVLVRKLDSDSHAEEKINIRFDDLINADMSSDKNPVLKPGDTIFVP